MKLLWFEVRRMLIFLLLVSCAFCIMPLQLSADEQTESAGETVDLGDVTVQAERLKDNIELTPGGDYHQS